MERTRAGRIFGQCFTALDAPTPDIPRTEMSFLMDPYWVVLTSVVGMIAGTAMAWLMLSEVAARESVRQEHESVRRDEI